LHTKHNKKALVKRKKYSSDKKAVIEMTKEKKITVSF